MTTMINRCVGANDELCKFPKCRCAKTEIVGLPVIDEKFVDEQLYRKDSASFVEVNDLPVEMVEPVPSIMRDAHALKKKTLNAMTVITKALRAAWRSFWREIEIQQRLSKIRNEPDPWK